MSTSSTWTDELKEQVIEMYNKEKPTPDTSIEVVKNIADQLGKTANGVRAVLQKADVYVKKVNASSAKGATDKPKKASKADAQGALITVIESAEQDVDEAIIEKLTGKAAVYFEELITKLTT